MAVFPSQLFNLGPEFYGFLLPWIFTFAIVYGLLVKTNIFGDRVNKQVSIALAFVIAFFVTGVGGPQLAAFFTNLFGGASIFLAGILVVILFASMFWTEKKESFLHKSSIPIIVVILIGIALFLGSTGTFVGNVWLDSSTAVMIFWIIIIIIAIYLVTRESKNSEGKKEG
jgi:hypothetical protein